MIYDKKCWNTVDCEWKEWIIGECSKECGGGIRINVREPKIDAENGGQQCFGSANITESCNTQECPGNSHQIQVAKLLISK